MKNVISASRRTDIPAFYWDWFLAQLKQGYVDVPNPMYPEKVYRVDLNPENIHSIVLWSKNMENVLKNPGNLDSYNLYFQYTITGYNKLLEPNVPCYERSMETLSQMVKKYKPEQFNIRFDPIVISANGEQYPMSDPKEARLAMFNRLCKDLHDMGLDNCRLTTSMMAVYPHVEHRLEIHPANIHFMTAQEEVEFMREMSKVAENWNRDIYTCANDRFVAAGIERIKKGHCVDADVLTTLFGKTSKAKDRSQREECGCAKSRDIGLYTQKCAHNCAYCYVK